MTQVLTGGLLAVSAALFLWVWTVFSRPPTPADALIAGTTRPLPAKTAAAVRDDGQRRRDEVAMILARPVFSPTRRPKEESASPAPAAAPITALPRMTAILIDGQLRSAIFDGDGKPTVLREGGHLGPFTIQSIEPQKVTIIGPDGRRTLRTTFSNDPPPTPAIPALPQGFAPPQPGQIVLPPGMPMPTIPGLPNLGPPR